MPGEGGHLRVNVREDPGLAAFGKQLRRADKVLAADFAELNEEHANRIASAARANAGSDGGVEAKAAAAIKAVKSASELAITITSTTAHPYALGAFYGAKRYKQFADWVGNQWEPGASDDGPYAVAPAITAEAPKMLEAYGAATVDFFNERFADAGGGTVGARARGVI